MNGDIIVTKFCTILLILNLCGPLVGVLHGMEEEGAKNPKFAPSAPQAPTAAQEVQLEPTPSAPPMPLADLTLDEFFKDAKNRPVFILLLKNICNDNIETLKRCIYNESDSLWASLNLTRNLDKSVGSYFMFAFEKCTLTFGSESEKVNVYELIVLAKARRCPIVMIVGGDCVGEFIKLTNDPMLAPGTIHSAILLDSNIVTEVCNDGMFSGLRNRFTRAKNWIIQKYNTLRKNLPTINYDVIEGSVYNFYSKIPGHQICKFSPGTNGFVGGHSKIFNIRCCDDSNSENINVPILDNGLLSEPFVRCIPKIIKKISQNFLINSDLICEITDQSIVINQPTQIVGKKLTNKHEGWSTPLAYEDQEKQFMQARLAAEEKFDIIQKHKLMLKNNESNTVTEIYSQSSSSDWTLEILKNKIQDIQPKTNKPTVLGTFMTPAPNGNVNTFYVVALVKDTTNDTNLSFKVKCNDARMDDIITVKFDLGQDADLFYYSIFKARVQIPTLQAASANLKCEITDGDGSVCDSITIPVLMQGGSSDFSFTIYGDLRKQCSEFPYSEDECGSAVKYLKSNYFLNERGSFPKLNIFLGDLVLNGWNVCEWGDVFTNFIKQLAQHSLVMSAIGLHDFASEAISLPGSLIGLKSRLVPGWRFDLGVNTLGKLFYYENEPVESQTAPLSDSVKSTHGYFDVGRVRFIHFPLVTEEPYTFGDEFGYADWILGKLKYEIAGGFEFDFDIADIFLENLDKAKDDKDKGNLDFIIVYGHSPLVTPQRMDLIHKGMINLSLEKQTDTRYSKVCDLSTKITGKIIEFVDAYFCGNNHVYNRCNMEVRGTIEENHFSKSIPIVTLGLGTKLQLVRYDDGGAFECEIKEKYAQTEPNLRINVVVTVKNEAFVGYGLWRNINENVKACFCGNNKQFLPAYLKCNYRSSDGTPRLECQLLSRANNEICVLDSFTINAHLQPKEQETFLQVQEQEQLQPPDVGTGSLSGAEILQNKKYDPILARMNKLTDLIQNPYEFNLELARFINKYSICEVSKEKELIISLEELAFACSDWTKSQVVSEIDEKIKKINSKIAGISSESFYEKLFEQTTEHNLNFLDIIIRSIRSEALGEISLVKSEDGKDKYFKVLQKSSGSTNQWIEMLNKILSWDQFKNKYAIGMLKQKNGCKNWRNRLKMSWLLMSKRKKDEGK